MAVVVAVTVSMTVSATVSVTVSASEGSDRGSEQAARPRQGQARSTTTRHLRLWKCQREPSQPRRHQDTKKNTKDILRAHLGVLVVQPRAGGSGRHASSTTRDDAACCGWRLPLPTATVPGHCRCHCPRALQLPLPLPRKLLIPWTCTAACSAGGWVEIPNPKSEMGRRAGTCNLQTF